MYVKVYWTDLCTKTELLHTYYSLYEFDYVSQFLLLKVIYSFEDIYYNLNQIMKEY